jgi:hypothetical protein
MLRNGNQFPTSLSHPAHGRRHPGAAALELGWGHPLLTAKIRP